MEQDYQCTWIGRKKYSHGSVHEHLNRMFQNSVSNLGPNVIDSSLRRTGNAFKGLVDLQQQFDTVTGVTPESSYHTFQSTTKDLIKIIEKLQQEKVFCVTPNRKHNHFHSFNGSIVNHIDNSELKDWMTSQLKRIICYSV